LIRKIPIPVVASIHGFALGGGFELALACDLIFAMPDVWFSLPELKYNMLPGGGGTVRLPQAIGYKQAFWNILTSSKITAQEALQKGIIQHIYETANPQEETISLLNAITKDIEHEAIAALKKVLISTQPYNPMAYKLEAEKFSYLLDKYAKKNIQKFMNK
ncbi:MAG: enoyl-CoA hydratase/isomerase family protein, partial [Salinivirgaceae bacterium]|nr:enoyl-CoA hydratase/isomerase family protein [Salinivirgaceae bacterium]